MIVSAVCNGRDLVNQPLKKQTERLLRCDLPFEKWRPQGDLNPCYRRERPVSWTGLDDGDANILAGRLGFEPRLTESESAVLPLNDRPNSKEKVCTDGVCACQCFFERYLLIFIVC